ncbi:MAG: flavin reductase [Prevotellaceae bacterium]|jgi:flavin reductase (DIM6/NTAB) family NADH-FMN oxidoreductase RutF|nr:flavin reductase [Prevotellaceae bacterium]
MRKNILFGAMLSVVMLTACGGQTKQGTSETATEPTIKSETVHTVTTAEVKDKTFDELFCSITENEIPESLFKLIGQDYTVITSGSATDFNSMTASWGGWGIMFNKPVTWCMLRANRFTLEKMREQKTYTMCYFDDNFKDQVMLFGTKSGRDSDKMKEMTLTPVSTVHGVPAYKEAKLIIECRLTEVTTVSPDDFEDASSKQFVVDGYNEAKAYHKLVFGEVTGIWRRR